MKFFIPLATSEQQAERIHTRIANHLTERGYAFTPQRVASVTYRLEAKLITDAVGASCDRGGLILAIFKNEVGYFICTYNHGVVWGEPITVSYNVVESAEDFDLS